MIRPSEGCDRGSNPRGAICIMKKSFSEKCYRVLRKVPKGRVTTYGAIAKTLGTKAYCAVGSSMNKNPYVPKVPCHRVVNSDGKIGGFASGVKDKIKILRREGVGVKNGRVVNFKKKLFRF